MNADLHDAYAADYDAEVLAYDCHIAGLLFGLCYEFTCPDQRLFDAGIGSGLSSALFAKAGLEVHGMDFSPAMLEICHDKGFAIDLRRHDIQKTPWPYSSDAFDHLVCCGVMHFIPDLEGFLTRRSACFAKRLVCLYHPVSNHAGDRATGLRTANHWRLRGIFSCPCLPGKAACPIFLHAAENAKVLCRRRSLYALGGWQTMRAARRRCA